MTIHLSTISYAVIGGNGTMWSDKMNVSWNNDINSTLDAEAEDSVVTFENVAIATIAALLIVCTTCGNIMVILCVFTYRPLKCVQNFYIVSLAVADMSVCILVMPFNVVHTVMKRWIFGVIFCDIWLTFDILCCTSSITHLCLIALDRYWAIHDPLRYVHKRTLKRVLLSVTLVWTLSVLISLPPLLGWNNRKEGAGNDPNFQCLLTDEKGYVIYSAMGSFYIPLSIMMFVYFKIYLVTKRRFKQRRKAMAKTTNGLNCETPLTVHAAENGTLQNQEFSKDEQSSGSPEKKESPRKRKRQFFKTSLRLSNRSRDSYKANSNTVYKFLAEKQKISLKREHRAARTLGIIMGVFTACWLPFFLMYIITPFCPTCDLHPTLVAFIVWLGYMNSFLNPFIYTVFNIDFRRGFLRLLCRKKVVLTQVF